jgi:hypothetical protein
MRQPGYTVTCATCGYEASWPPAREAHEDAARHAAEEPTHSVSLQAPPLRP